MPATDDDAQDGSFYVTLSLNPDPGFTLRFDGLIATEELGRPFLIALDVSSAQPRGNIGTLLGASVTVTMTAADGEKTHFNGILARAAYAGLVGGVYRYHFELRPWIWLLSRIRDCRIFQKQSAWDTITQVFRAAGFSAQDRRQNQAGDTVLEYCVQYRETSLDFVTRLMETYGLYYYFEHQDRDHILVLADDPNAHTALGTPIAFQFSQTEVRAVEQHIWEWTSDLHLQPGAATFRDYNFTTPAADLTAKSLHPGDHEYGRFEVYDYPGQYETVSDGQKLADVRMQGLAARAQLFDGKSNARDLRAGIKFTLSGHADSTLNQEYLVIRAITALGIAEGASDDRGNLVDTNRVEFTAIPGSTPFRLEPLTARPSIRGPQTAKVVGESGDEITVDPYGRIKVQFYWDRVGTSDQNSSCWIRVAQPWAGAGWGALYTPRIGMEVVVEFLEGNPDRPLVTGVVYNASQTVPYPLPAKKVVSGLKTNSSKGGGGFNELRFDDTKGSELVFLQAQYDYTRVVLHSETATITQDATTTVQQGNRAVTVSQGNDSTTAGQSIKLTANTSIELTVGGTSLKLDPSGVTISGPKIAASASAMMTLDGGAAMTLSAGLIKIN